MTYQYDIGRLGEDLACEFLAASGFAICERNFRTKFGEIDVIAWQKAENGGPTTDVSRLLDGDGTNVTVFVEVKTRTSASFGTPLEAFDRRKRLRFERAVRCYLADHPDIREWRIDFIGIMLDRRGGMIYREHIKDVAIIE